MFFWSDGGLEQVLNYPGSHKEYVMVAQEFLFGTSCL